MAGTETKKQQHFAGMGTHLKEEGCAGPCARGWGGQVSASGGEGVRARQLLASQGTQNKRWTLRRWTGASPGAAAGAAQACRAAFAHLRAGSRALPYRG